MKTRNEKPLDERNMIRPFDFSAVDVADATLKMPDLSIGNYIRQWAKAVALLALDKEVADLTEEEKFAIALIAGVPLARNENAMDENDFTMKMKTVPCSIVKIDGKFHVAHKEDSK